MYAANIGITSNWHVFTGVVGSCGLPSLRKCVHLLIRKEKKRNGIYGNFYMYISNLKIYHDLLE